MNLFKRTMQNKVFRSNITHLIAEVPFSIAPHDPLKFQISNRVVADTGQQNEFHKTKLDAVGFASPLLSLPKR